MNFFKPIRFTMNDRIIVYKIIQDNPFATVITSTDAEPQVSQIPLYLLACKKFLIGHMARANNHWRILEQEQKTTILFHGPHHYISPAWYEEKENNVPTWNYATVFIKGFAKEITNSEEILDQLQSMTIEEEKKNHTSWALDKSISTVEKMVEGIFFFKFTITQLDSKFKMSQNEPDSNKLTIIRELAKKDDTRAQETADIMALANESLQKF